MEIERFGRHISSMDKMKTVFDMARKVSPTLANVLILGETGTGKELMAEAVYLHSDRADKPMISVNCASLPASLIESELFGFKKGSFTGANADYEGKFEQADGGTLFLDEIGDMPLSAQAKILRIIDQKKVTRIGDSKSRDIDIRIIAATNKDIEQEVALGNFRSDLYYRLNEVTIQLLPLREREEDLHLLIEEIISEFNQKLGRNFKGISVAALGILEKHEWPGNIRELKNIIKRAMLFNDAEQIWVETLPITLHSLSGNESPKNSESSAADGFDSLEDMEKKYILRVLEHTRWKKKAALDILKIGRTTLYEKLRKYNIENPIK